MTQQIPLGTLMVPPIPLGMTVDIEIGAIYLKIYLDPRGKGRPRVDRGRAHTDEKTAAWASDFEKLTLMVVRSKKDVIKALWQKPIAIALELYYKKPKARAEWFCTSSIDNDNAEKMVWDSCQGIFFKNDNRIISNCTFKDWAPEGERPHVKIRIYPLKKKEI